MSQRKKQILNEREQVKKDVSEYRLLFGNDKPLPDYLSNAYYKIQKDEILENYYSFGRIGGIYSITNIVTGEFYIGSSVNIEARTKMHFLDLTYKKHSNSRLQSAWDQYGKENFIIEILWEAIYKANKNTILLMEQHYINLHKPTYNIKQTVDYVKHGENKPAKHQLLKKPKKTSTPYWKKEPEKFEFESYVAPEIENYCKIHKNQKSFTITGKTVVFNYYYKSRTIKILNIHADVGLVFNSHPDLVYIFTTLLTMNFKGKKIDKRIKRRILSPNIDFYKALSFIK